METLSTVFDVAVIGAGVAGLICAQQLRHAGYCVVIIEKSRGAGGRLATHRLHDTRAEHGARYLKAQGEMVEKLIKIMRDRHLLQLWTDKLYQFGSEISDINENLYVPSADMNCIRFYQHIKEEGRRKKEEGRRDHLLSNSFSRSRPQEEPPKTKGVKRSKTNRINETYY